jgi:DNA-binding transcriptional ArsR family regulator
MEMKTAVTTLSALAHESRLAIFRYLVQNGPGGSAVGDIARELELPGATLSFHLANLKQAGLVDVNREGRSLRYSPRFDTVGLLIGFLLKDCCGGQACVSDTDLCLTEQKE